MRAGGALTRALLTYPWRPAEALAALFDRPERTLARWDGLMRDGRYLVTLAGADAHARLGFRDYEGDDGVDSPALALPTYESAFRSFTVNALLDAPLGGDPVQAATRLVGALGRGRTFTAIDGIAGPPRFEFFARTQDGLAGMGDSIPPGEPAVLVARVVAPAGAVLRLLRNGVQLAESSGPQLEFATTPVLFSGERGAGFRVEVVVPGSPGEPSVPWIVSNPIFVSLQPGSFGDPSDAPGPGGGNSSAGPLAARAPAAGESGAHVGIDLNACRVENGPTSMSALEIDASGDRLRWTWRLAEGREPSWVAISCAVPRLPGPDASIAFDARADAPIRVSLQMREAPSNRVPQRWQRTFFVDDRPGRHRVALSSLEPVEKGGPASVPADARTVLFVIDGTHGLPGMRRIITISEATLEAAPRR